jgi:hypothetical protein
MSSRGFSVTDPIVTKRAFLGIIRAEISGRDSTSRTDGEPTGITVKLVEKVDGPKKTLEVGRNAKFTGRHKATRR